MLQSVDLLTTTEATQITDCLKSLTKTIEKEDFVIETQFENMHSKIEHILIEKLNNTGKKYIPPNLETTKY